MILLFSFTVIALVSFVIVIFSTRPTASQKIAEKRLASIQHVSADEHSAPVLNLVEKPGTEGGFDRFLEQRAFARRLKTLILHAGSKSTVSSVVLMSGVLILVCGLLAHLFLPVVAAEAVAGIVGGVLPYGVLTFRRSKRLNALDEALPDTIDLLSRALRAGHSMNSAIEVIAEQGTPPLALEFQQIAQQQKFGMPFRDSLIQLTENIPSKDFHFLVTAILVQKETGGDLTEILDRTVEVIRERMRIAGEIRTFTAQGRITGWILGGLPLAMLGALNIVNPGYDEILFKDPFGQKLLYGAGVMMVVGVLIIRFIVNIEV